MSKKILLLSSVIFLSSCGANSISELGDKFLDLINPSDAATGTSRSWRRCNPSCNG